MKNQIPQQQGMQQPQQQKPVSTMDQLHVRLTELADKAKVIENTADAEHRSMTDEEVRESNQINAAFRQIEAEIAAREASAAMEARLSQPMRRVTEPAGLERPENSAPASAQVQPYQRFTGGMPAGGTNGSLGFRSMGEWAIQARRTHLNPGAGDPRILNAPSTFGSEGVNTDGGFAVPPDFRENIMKLVLGEESLLARTDQQTTSSNGLTLPIDATTPWQSSGGVLGGWVGEGGTITGSKPKLAGVEVKTHKLAALVPMTDELLEDVPAMTRWLMTKVPEKFDSSLNDAIVNGNGVAKPMGLLSSACKVTVDAVSGQGAGTVVATNIAKMWGRLYGKLRPRAVWLINQDVEPQLQLLTMPGTSPAYPVYLPPGGFSASPYATLYGRPVIAVEACQAVGTEGDIILTDLTQYLTVLKAGGMRSDVSIHLYFDSDQTAFRFIMRVGGQSYWAAAITRQNGSNTLSPIVTLNSSRT